MTDELEAQSVKVMPKHMLCIGNSGVTETQAVAWAKSKGAKVLYYFPENKTAYIPAKVATKAVSE